MLYKYLITNQIMVIYLSLPDKNSSVLLTFVNIVKNKKIKITNKLITNQYY